MGCSGLQVPSLKDGAARAAARVELSQAAGAGLLWGRPPLTCPRKSSCPWGVQRGPPRASRRPRCALQRQPAVQTGLKPWPAGTVGPGPASSHLQWAALIIRARAPSGGRDTEKQVIQEGMGRPWQAVSPSKSPPRSLSFPKVCPSGRSHGPVGQHQPFPAIRAAVTPPHPQGVLGSWAQVPLSGCPSQGRRDLAPAAT